MAQHSIVDLKSSQVYNSALLYNKGHNFWKSVSTRRMKISLQKDCSPKGLPKGLLEVHGTKWSEKSMQYPGKSLYRGGT